MAEGAQLVGGDTRAREDAWNAYVAEAVALRASVRRVRVLAAAGDEDRSERGALQDAAYVADVRQGAELLAATDLDGAARVLDELDAEREDPTHPHDGEAIWRVERQAEALRSALTWRNPGIADRPAQVLVSTIRKSARSCKGSSVLVRCRCGAHMVEGGCARSDCVRCAPARTAERARVVYRKLLDSLDVARWRNRCAKARRTGDLGCACVRCRRSRIDSLWSLRVSVLTMPPEMRDAFVSRDAWKRLRREVWRLFRDEMGAAFACITTHPVGDEDPSQFHPHLNVLWSAGRPGPGKLPRVDLDRLRMRWQQVLERCAYRPCEARGLAPGDRLDVWGEFVTHPGAVGDEDDRKIRHRARYYARLFVAWGRWIPKAVQWYGDYARSVPTRCPKCAAPWEPVHAAGRQVEALCSECGCTRAGYEATACACVECCGGFKIIGFGAEARESYRTLLALAAQREHAPPTGTPTC